MTQCRPSGVITLGVGGGSYIYWRVQSSLDNQSEDGEHEEKASQHSGGSEARAQKVRKERGGHLWGEAVREGGRRRLKGEPEKKQQEWSEMTS